MIRRRAWWRLGLLVSLFLSGTGSWPQDAALAITLPGQTFTLLPDGRWLRIGGQALTGVQNTAEIWDARTGATITIPGGLHTLRAWHTATLLPDGTVLVVGGVGVAGHVVDEVERVDPQLLAVETLPGTGITPRAHHTATLLTDGRILLVGGVSADGRSLGDAEVWDPESNSAQPTRALLITPRSEHKATLLSDGTVLAWGGLDQAGTALNNGERYDPLVQAFLPGPTVPPAADPTVPAALAASLPVDGAAGVPVDALVALRFTQPLRVETVNSLTVFLSGPRGLEPVTIIPAEAGMLAFLTPEDLLEPGVTYTVTLNGLTDDAGHAVPFTTVRFTTVPATLPGGSAPTEGAARAATPSESSTSLMNDEEWRPDPSQGTRGWRTGYGPSSWQSLPPLQAAPGMTALAGQVLRLNGQPLPDVTLRIEGRTARTDVTGRFLLSELGPGHHELLIDGRTANQPGRTYGLFEVGVRIAADQTTVLPYTIWMPRLDTAHAVRIPAYTMSETVVTTPRIPGLELRIPAHAAIRDHEGQPVTEITITPIPLDRPPFPLPEGVDVPLYFTVQPGGAYVYSRSGAGAQLIYPNARQVPPGTRFDFWNYDAAGRGWFVYGQGGVVSDGSQIVPDPGVAFYEFTGAMVGGPGLAPPPDNPPPDNDGGSDGDPVDLATGLFVLRKTDVVLPDVLPITLTRTYRPRDTISRAFGIGATHPYDMFLVGTTFPYTYVDLILPDGGRVHFDRISPGTGYADAVYEANNTPTLFFKARIVWNGTGYTLTRLDGMAYDFREAFGATRPMQGGLLQIRDRFGNRLTITRDAAGNVQRMTTPHGRALEFAVDASHRITQASDNTGRKVRYSYDVDGRLATVTDPAGGVTQYTYDSAHRMLALTDARGIVFLRNEYDAAGRVSRQTQADGTTFQFTYTTDANGKITQTDVTDPRGIVRRVTVNASGYVMTDTRALGRPEQQVITFERDAATNRVVARTDALGRRTSYTYDALGNVTAVTRLAGTPNAVTTGLTYEPTFSQVASITDPLGHTTTFGYNAQGALTTITDALQHQTVITPNAAGQPTAVRDPLNQSVQFGYQDGDLVSVTDPVGQVTRRVVDGAGRVVGVTDPLGRTSRSEYDALNRLSRVIDAKGGATAFSYDPNGNLLSVIDARNNVTSYAYNSMDRLQTRTDPLQRSESYVYDGNGNLTSFTDRKSQVTSSTYDALNRLIQRSYAEGSTTTYTWDAGNRLTQVVDSISGTITRTYDLLNRLTQEATPQGTVSYTYDAAGRRTSMTVAGQPTVSYAYDNADRLTAITQGSSVISFAYDNAGRRTTLTLPNNVSTEYAYDPASRLTGLIFKHGSNTLGTLAYTYDSNTQRRQVGGAWGRTGLPQAVASANYDAANRQLTFGSQTLAYDLNGNLISDGPNTYTWNARDQLGGITGPTPASFAYDALGRRRQKTINGGSTTFLYDGLNPIQEAAGGDVTNLLAGLGLDEFFVRTNASGASSLLADVLGSVLAITDGAGAVSTEYTYEPFGTATATGAPSTNELQFTGRENDGTGLYYYRARYYKAALQRFLSEDPIEFWGGDVNLYVYAFNAPSIYVDPLGERFGWIPRGSPAPGQRYVPPTRATRPTPNPPLRPGPGEPPLGPNPLEPHWHPPGHPHPWHPGSCPAGSICSGGMGPLGPQRPLDPPQGPPPGGRKDPPPPPSVPPPCPPLGQMMELCNPLKGDI